MIALATRIAPTPCQKPSMATTRPPGTALVRIIGNPNQTAETVNSDLRWLSGTGSRSNSSDAEASDAVAAAVPAADSVKRDPRFRRRGGGCAPGGAERPLDV